MTLTVFQCTECGTTLFPARYGCPSCGATKWRDIAVGRGVVAEATVIRHRVAVAGGSGAQGEVFLASVNTEAGPVVIARLDAPTTTGDEVTLECDAEQRIVAHRI